MVLHPRLDRPSPDGAVVPADPVVRQEDAEEGLGDRHLLRGPGADLLDLHGRQLVGLVAWRPRGHLQGRRGVGPLRGPAEVLQGRHRGPPRGGREGQGPGQVRRRGRRRGGREGRGARDRDPARGPLPLVVRDRQGHHDHRHPGRRPVGADARRRDDHLAARPHLLHGLRRRGPALHALLRLPLALHRIDAVLRARPEHPPAHRGMGAGGRLFLCAHRALVGGETEHRRGHEGVPDQPRG